MILAGDFEAERDDLLQRLDACSTQQATLLDLDREHAQRSDEVVELQKVIFCAFSGSALGMSSL